MKILLIGDLHSNFTNIKKLNQKIIKFNLNYILINGDFINIYHDIENDSLSTDQEFLSVLNTILNNNNTPTLYIPGNHDPTIQFQNNHKNNLHKKWANLGPIDCFGLGGAVGGKLIFNGKEAFPGYPYTDDNQLGSDFKLNYQKKQYLPNHSVPETPKQFIIMTHCGLAGTGTSDQNKNPGNKESRIDMGSQSLTNFFNGDFDFEQLICWVHGHSHACSGISHIAGVPIINPGSLKEGKFAILELKCSKNRWYIASTTFHQLDDDDETL